MVILDRLRRYIKIWVNMINCTKDFSLIFLHKKKLRIFLKKCFTKFLFGVFAVSVYWIKQKQWVPLRWTHLDSCLLHFLKKLFHKFSLKGDFRSNILIGFSFEYSFADFLSNILSQEIRLLYWMEFESFNLLII